MPGNSLWETSFPPGWCGVRATIETDALADLGQNPVPGGGQCKAFANAMVIAASGGTHKLHRRRPRLGPRRQLTLR